MAESAVSRSILRWLRGEGFWAAKVHGDPMQERIIDILACVDGRFLGIETKDDEDEEPTPLQQYHLRKIRKAGGTALKASSLDEVKAVVVCILAETRRRR